MTQEWSVDTGVVRTPHFWVRFVALIFGIVAFAPVAEGSGYSRFDFTIFCGVTTMVLSLGFMACYFLRVAEKGARGLIPLVIDIVWCIFWLSCAAALSDMLTWFWDGFYWGAAKSRVQVACAFSWLSWFVSIGAVVLDVLDMRNGQTVVMPPAAAAAAGAAPAGTPAGAQVSAAV